MKLKLFTAVLLVTFFATIVNAQNKVAQTLNGTTYKIQITDLANPNEAKTDLVSFSEKMFDSEFSQSKGFSKTSFIEKIGADGIFFQVTFSSEKEGVMIWNGSVKGNVIQGKISWEKNGQEPAKYSYTGSLENTGKK